MLKLYYAPGTVALAAHIALIEAGAKYEAIRLDFAKGEQNAPAYRAINPKGRVPALVTERGVLSETPAILTYIAQSFPEARLAPQGDVFAFAELQAFLGYLSSTVHVATAHFTRGVRWATQQASFDDMKAKVPENAAQSLALIENEAMRGQWVFGDTYTIADPYLFRVVSWMPRYGVGLADYPKIAAHFAAMKKRPAVQQAIREAGETI